MIRLVPKRVDTRRMQAKIRGKFHFRGHSIRDNTSSTCPGLCKRQTKQKVGSKREGVKTTEEGHPKQNRSLCRK